MYVQFRGSGGNRPRPKLILSVDNTHQIGKIGHRHPKWTKARDAHSQIIPLKPLAVVVGLQREQQTIMDSKTSLES